MHGRDRGHRCGVKGSRLCGISCSWEVSGEEPEEQRRNQSPRDMRKGGGSRGGGRGSYTTAKEKKQGAKHKASQIDLSLHQESCAKPLHYHTRHTL